MEEDPCRIEIHDGHQGEGVAFTFDGRGIVTINEGAWAPLYYVEF